MRKSVLLLTLTITLYTVVFAAEPVRPRIIGIAHVAFYSSQPEASKKFYGELLGLSPGAWQGSYRVGRQGIEIEPDGVTAPAHRIAHIAFATDDAEGMRLFLASRGVSVPYAVQIEKSGTRWFALKDPEGHDIEFVQETPISGDRKREISHRVIHAGFVVHNRELQDRFYRDLLGFRLYWQGGMKEGQTDWVDMQVPEGTDWLEYMLQPSEAELDQRTLGIVNHVALGVADVKATAHQLESRGWKASEWERPQLGRDGKWQLNLYDPDGTRVELMEFEPVEKPCCSNYLRPHPTSKD